MQAEPTPSARGGYRPEIDGLRSVAVLLVVAFHADVALVAGGFIGVDVFFVLSGFLITGLLVDEGRKRSIDLGAFYARRSRRLLPAALVVILAISLTWLLIASTVERQGLGGDARAAALYISNWHFAAQATDYFHQADSPSPFLHFWSLSAEEQFYLVWPALVAGAVLLARRTRRAVVPVVRVLAVVLLVASLVSLWLTARAGADSYAYFATTNRVYQLLAGALLALHLRARREPMGTRLAAPLQFVAIAAMLLLATRFVEVGSTVRGLVVTLVAIPLLWALDRSPGAPVASLLSSRPLVWVGKISYGVYLWHWPVVLVLRRYWHLEPYQAAILCTVLSLAIAAVSYRVLEQPIRLSSYFAARGKVTIAGGLALSVLVGVMVAPALLAAERAPVFSAPLPADAGAAPVVSGAGAAGTVAPTRTPVPSATELARLLAPAAGAKCLPQPLPTCLLHRGHGPTVAVLADSHGEVFKPVFADIAAKYDLTLYLSTFRLCPWLRGVYPTGKHPDCKQNKESWYQQALPSLKADVVITMSRAYDDAAFPHELVTDAAPNVVDPGTVLNANWGRAVDELRHATKRVVIVHPWPSASFPQKVCLSTARFVEQCAATASPLPSDTGLRALDAQRDDVDVIDLDPEICPRLPVCDAMVDGHVVRFDNNHLTADMAKALQPVLEQQLLALRVVPTS